MLLTFINLNGTEAALLFFLIFSTVVFAGYKALKAEQGFTQILWILAIFLFPPVVAILYLLKTYVFSPRIERSAGQ
jgi:hypothetical protein